MGHRLLFATVLACFASAAGAQNIPGLPSGATSILSGGLPNIAGMGLPNVAGVLGYCAKNKILSGSGVGNLVTGLANKPGVASSPDYRAGSLGNIVTGRNSAPVSLGSLPSSLKSQACNMVMEKGAKLL